MENINKNIKYVKASLDDEEQIKSILKNLKGDRDNFNLKRFVVAKYGELVVGCIRVKVFDGGILELSSLAVLPEYQNKGIGSKLVKNFLQFEQSRPIFLLTSLDKESFYKKFGFIIKESQKLPEIFKKEYDRIISLPFANNIKVIAMALE